MATIGIDLGTKNTCAAVWWNNRVEIIHNDRNRTTPSYVAFTETERLVGDAAKIGVANPNNTVFAVKRFIGRRFSDQSVQSDMKFWPFRIVPDDGDKAVVAVQFDEKEKRFSPEELSSMVLKKMKETAERFLGFPIKNAVVGVPANFNYSQRLATKHAAAMAGLNILRIINEPTATAIARFHNQMITGQRNVLIFDLGGGTLDVSLVRVGEGSFAVKATAGDTHLGGVDFDNRLVLHFVDEIKSKQNLDVSADARKMRKIRTACENAKKNLSVQQSTEVYLDFFHDEVNFPISRVKFEEICSDLFGKCLLPIVKCLADAKIDKIQVQDVVLMGGSSRIPKIQQLLSDFFGRKDLNMTGNFDEDVAYGAAVQAAILAGEGSQMFRDLKVVDISPHSLGTDLLGGIMGVVIPRNTPIPTKKMTVCRTAWNNQTRMSIKIYEGEGKRYKRNNLLGSFTLDGIPPAPRGTSKVNISFEIDADGILIVSAENTSAGVKKDVIFTQEKCNDVGVTPIKNGDRMAEEEEIVQAEDEQVNCKVKMLVEYANRMRSFIKDKVGESLDEGDEKDIESAVDDAMLWLKKEGFCSVKEVKRKQRELELEEQRIIFSSMSKSFVRDYEHGWLV